MRAAACLVLSLLGGPPAAAQAIFREDEDLARHRPEAWAMHYFAGASLMTSAGATPRAEAGAWRLGIDLGHVPSLDERQRRVGFHGTKLEDLDKSPVFGRLRFGLSLPAGWFAEIGYTPPLAGDGVRPHGLVALSLGRRLISGTHFSLSGRVFAQRGDVRGDITCPREVAATTDAARNPFGCRAPSRDTVSLDHHGIELVPAFDAGAWQWHAGVGAVRADLAVQVDALTFDVRDRTRLTSRTTLPMLTVGATRQLGRHWSVTAEMLHVPLEVRRSPDGGRERDPLTSARLQLRYQWP